MTPQDWTSTGATAPNANPPSRRAVYLQFALAAVLLIGYLALAWRGREPTDIGGADELEYLALSQSISQGSYREIYLADQPLAVKYPPAFPAWIALVRALSGERLDAVLAANIAFLAGTLLLLFIAARQLLGGWLSVAFLALCVVNPWVLETGGNKMSEGPFIFATTAALFLAWKVPVNARARVVGIVALALLAFLTRVAGLSIVIAIGIWLLSRRSRGELVGYAVASAAVVGAWMSYATWARKANVSKSYILDFAAVPDPGSGHVFAQLLERTWNGTTSLVTRTLGWVLAVPTVQGTAIDNLLWIAVILSLVAVGVGLLWQRWRALAAFLVMYGLLLVAWPFTQDRLVGVIVPHIFLAMLLAARTMVERFAFRGARGALVVFVALLVLGNAWRGLERDAERAQCNYAAPYYSTPCYDVPERARGARLLAAAGERVRAESRPGDLVVTSKEASLYFLTGRRVVDAGVLLHDGGGDVLDAARRRGARYFVLTFYSDVEDGGLARAFLPHCSKLLVVASYLPDGLLVSLDARGPSAPDACAALTQFLRLFPPQ